MAEAAAWASKEMDSGEWGLVGGLPWACGLIQSFIPESLWDVGHWHVDVSALPGEVGRCPCPWQRFGTG